MTQPLVWADVRFMVAFMPFNWARLECGSGQGAVWLTIGPVELQFSWWGKN